MFLSNILCLSYLVFFLIAPIDGINSVKITRDYSVQVWSHIKAGSTWTVTLMGRYLSLVHDTLGVDSNTQLDHLELVKVLDEAPESELCPISLEDSLKSTKHCCAWWSVIKNCESSSMFGFNHRYLPHINLDKHAEFVRNCDTDHQNKPGRKCKNMIDIVHFPLKSTSTTRHVMLFRDPKDIAVKLYIF